MKFIEKVLSKITGFQARHYKFFLIFIILITLVLGFFVPKISMESDMSKNNPQSLEIYQLNDKVTAKFGGQDVIILVLELDDKSNSQGLIKDIRDEKVVSYLKELSDSLSEESQIDSVSSIASYFSSQEQITNQNLERMFEKSPSLNSFFSKDFDTTFMLVKSDVGAAEKKVNELTDLINEKLDSFSKPAGTTVKITGMPPMRVKLAEILFSDAKFTLLIATILIFILLIFLEKSLLKSILILVPLLLGLIWTLGTMVLLDLKISMATAGLGAMVLGLGVEYGVFMLTRYNEERDKGKSQIKALETSVPGVGSAIIGSGFTTTMGFLALTLSISPMMQKLGLSLALGIFYCLLSAVLVAPVIFIGVENTTYWIDHRLKKIFTKRCKVYEK